jgi:hypothetical protein
MLAFRVGVVPSPRTLAQRHLLVVVRVAAAQVRRVLR